MSFSKNRKEEDECINVGDLVGLKNDKGNTKGIGIVLQKRSLKPGKDFSEMFSQKEIDMILEDLPELFDAPMYLVLWSRDAEISFAETVSKPLWLFGSELTVVSKAN